jgi:hypothetical protein
MKFIKSAINKNLRNYYSNILKTALTFTKLCISFTSKKSLLSAIIKIFYALTQYDVNKRYLNKPRK